jgi:hypothetical protein
MTLVNLKPAAKAPDQNRKALAAAIALHAGAKRDLRVADESASLAAQRCWQAQAQLDELRKVPEPKGSLAAAFTSSVAADAPCETAVLQRSGVDARAQIVSAENEFSIWDQTREECDLAAREKEAAVATARDRVERAARAVICNSKYVARLIDELTALQSEVVNKRSVLRFIWRASCNGELERPLSEQVERVLRQNIDGLESTPASAAWSAAFNELITNPEAELPS